MGPGDQTKAQSGESGGQAQEIGRIKGFNVTSRVTAKVTMQVCEVRFQLPLLPDTGCPRCYHSHYQHWTHSIAITVATAEQIR